MYYLFVGECDAGNWKEMYKGAFATLDDAEIVEPNAITRELEVILEWCRDAFVPPNDCAEYYVKNEERWAEEAIEERKEEERGLLKRWSEERKDDRELIAKKLGYSLEDIPVEIIKYYYRDTPTAYRRGK